jgi:hypothetical protein
MMIFGRHCRCLALAIWLGAALSVTSARVAPAEEAGGAGLGAPQQAGEGPAAPAAGSVPAQPQPAQRQGLLHDVQHWWQQSFGDFKAKMEAARRQFDNFHTNQSTSAKDAAAATEAAVKDAAQAAKDVATTVVRLPNTRLVELRDRCELAGNGAPDCAAAATDACRRKGFSTGQPVDVRSSQKCPAAVMLSGRTPAEGECPEETFVLRAICQ